MVNADQAVSLKPNSGALVGESYREKENRIERAVKDKFVITQDDYAWVADFTDSQLVIVRNGGKAEVFGYANEGGKILIDDSGSPVVRQESWVAMAANKFKSLFSKPQVSPATNNSTEGDMPLTQEEKKDLVGDITQALAANFAEQLKPINEKVDALQVNHQKLEESLTANQRAEETEMRKEVADKYGEVVANSLQGQALIDMHKQLGEAASLAGNSGAQQEQVGAPNPAEYFKGAQ